MISTFNTQITTNNNISLFAVCVVFIVIILHFVHETKPAHANILYLPNCHAHIQAKNLSAESAPPRPSESNT